MKIATCQGGVVGRKQLLARGIPANLQLHGCTVVRVDEVHAGTATVARFLNRPASRTAP